MAIAFGLIISTQSQSWVIKGKILAKQSYSNKELTKGQKISIKTLVVLTIIKYGIYVILCELIDLHTTITCRAS